MTEDGIEICFISSQKLKALSPIDVTDDEIRIYLKKLHSKKTPFSIDFIDVGFFTFLRSVQ